jgi:hypothetical protein
MPSNTQALDAAFVALSDVAGVLGREGQDLLERVQSILMQGVYNLDPDVTRGTTHARDRREAKVGEQELELEVRRLKDLLAERENESFVAHGELANYEEAKAAELGVILTKGTSLEQQQLMTAQANFDDQTNAIREKHARALFAVSAQMQDNTELVQSMQELKSELFQSQLMEASLQKDVQALEVRYRRSHPTTTITLLVAHPTTCKVK